MSTTQAAMYGVFRRGIRQSVWPTREQAEARAGGDAEVHEISEASLRPELRGLEGWRIEATNRHGERYRFIVGKSTGWAPIHLEIKRRDSSGGMGDQGPYTDIRRIERVL